jgi:hypothetical protein
LYIVQGTEQVGNLFIDRGRQINPGGYTNASDQGDWLEANSDVGSVNNDQTTPLWPMYPTGEGGEVAGSSEDASTIRHPGVQFDGDYPSSPHASQ